MGVFTTSKQFALEIDMPGWWLAGSSVDLDFVHGRYFDNSLSAPAAVGNLLSISRASVGYAKTSSGTLTQFATGQLRITDLGLLVEDARTNLLFYSVDPTNGLYWIPQQSTVTANQAVAPDGTTTMTQITEDTTTNRHILFQQQGSITANSNYVFSVFVKDVNRRYVSLSLQSFSGTGGLFCYADLQSGTITDSGISAAGTGTVLTAATIEAFGSGIYRISLVGIINSTDTAVPYNIICLADRATQSGGAVSGQNPSYTGTSKSIYAWGPQFELGTFATSYIPTTTTSATRAADAITITGNASTIIAGTALSFVGQFNSVPAGQVERFIGASSSSFFYISAANALHLVLNTDFNTAVTSLRPGLDKAGYAVSGINESIVCNGGTVATSTGGAVVSAPFTLGSDQGGTPSFGYFQRATFWNSKLADATLQALTAP